MEGSLGRFALSSEAHRPYRSMAVVGAHRWEEVVELFTAGASVLQSETRYFESSEMQDAWEWARTAKHAEDVPVRVIFPPTGIWKDYRPEFLGLVIEHRTKH